MAPIPAHPEGREAVDTSKPFYTNFGEIKVDTTEDKIIIKFDSNLGGLPLTTGEVFSEGLIKINFKNLVDDVLTVTTLIRSLCAEATQNTSMTSAEFQTQLISRLREDGANFDASELEQTLGAVEN